MKIYDYEGFPNPARVRIALKEKGLSDQVAFETVDVPNGAHRTEAFRAINPTATVPVLETDEGARIAECTAITEYIDHSAGEPTLTGRTPTERGEIHMMSRRAEAGLLEAVSDYFHHATPGLGPDLETDQMPAWGERQKSKAQKTMRYLNDVLAARPYLAGDAFTMADITAFAGMAFADFAKVAMPEEAKHLKAWRDRVASRPSVA